MSRYVVRLVICPAVFAVVVLTAGCFSSNNSLPSTVIVELPDGTMVEVEQGSGVPSLVESSWDFFQAGSPILFVTVTFGATGNLESFTNSTLGAEVFGDTLLFDGARHATSQDGLEYAAATFGAETADSTGFAFDGQLSAFFFGLLVGTGQATASGTFDPMDVDRMTGTFTFSSELTVPIEIPGANQDLQFDYVAIRIDPAAATGKTRTRNIGAMGESLRR